MIYVYFGEFYWFNTTILGFLEKYLKTHKLTLLTFKDYATVLKIRFKHSKNLTLISPNNELYMEYRRTHHGQPATGNPDNFKIILSLGMVSPSSQLLYTNSWLEHADFYLNWRKKNRLNTYGDPINTTYSKEPLPDKQQNNEWSLYEFLVNKFPDKPWEKYSTPRKQSIGDLFLDLMKVNKTYSLQTKIVDEGRSNHYIHIFPRNRPGHWNRGHQSHINIKTWIKICKYLKQTFPERKICCHGHMESFAKKLEPYIDVQAKSIKESINLFYNADLLISPASGMVDLALNCGLKRVIYIRETEVFGKWGNNPFKAKRWWVNIATDWNQFARTANRILRHPEIADQFGSILFKLHL